MKILIVTLLAALVAGCAAPPVRTAALNPEVQSFTAPVQEIVGQEAHALVLDGAG